MTAFRKNRRLILLLLLTSFALVLTGCSHTQAYRNDRSQPLQTKPTSGDKVRQRVLLVGDAGEPQACAPDRVETAGKKSSRCEPVLALMEYWAGQSVDGNKPFSLFLGDNIYPDGLPDSGDALYSTARRKWDEQHRVLLLSDSKGLFVPGNHDWGGPFGKDHKFWMNQQRLMENKVQAQDPSLVVAKMESGCPGPASIDQLDGVKIIVLDSQWWLTDDELMEESSCARTDAKSIAEAQSKAMAELTRMLRQAEAAGQEVIVATHHPTATHGPHGAWYRWFAQDIRGKKNRAMTTAIKGAFRRSNAPPLIHAAGHDHSLQVLRGQNQGAAAYNLVSGAGSQEKLTSVWHGDDTLFAHQHTGIMLIDFMQSGAVFLRVIEPARPNAQGKRAVKGKLVYETQLK